MPPEQPAQAVADEGEAAQQADDPGCRGRSLDPARRHNESGQAAGHDQSQPEGRTDCAGGGVQQRRRVERVGGPVLAGQIGQFHLGDAGQQLVQIDPAFRRIPPARGR